MPNATDIAQLGLGTEQLQKDVSEALALLKQVTDAIDKIESVKAKPGSLTDLIAQNKQLAEVQTTLVTSINNVTVAQNNNVTAQQKQLNAWQQLNKAYKDADTLAKSYGATLGEESEEFKKASAQADEYKAKIDAINAARKNSGQTPVVSTDNLADLQQEQNAAQGTGTVVSAAEQEQAQLEQSAIAANNYEQAMLSLADAKEKEAAATEQTASYEEEELTALEQLAQTYIVATNELNANSVAIKANADALKSKSITEQEAFEVESKLIAEQALLKQNLVAARTELTAGAKTVLDSKGAYALLNDQFTAAKKNALDIGASQGKNSDAFKTAAAEAKALSTTLKEIDDEVGINTRSVGDYEGAIGRAFGKLTSLDSIGGKLITSFGRMGIHFLAFTIAMKGIEVVTEAVSSKIKEMAGDSFDSLNEKVLKAIDNETAYNKTFQETNNLFDQANQNRAKFAQASNQNLQSQYSLKQAGGEDILTKDKQDIDILTKEYESAQKNLQRVSKLYGIDPNDNKAFRQALKDRLNDVESYSDGVKELEKQLNDPDITKYSDTKNYLQKQLDDTKAQLSVAQQVYNTLFDAATNYDNKLGALQTGRSKNQFDEAAEQRKLILQTTQQEVDLQQAKNNAILSDERSSLEERLKAIQSNASAEKKLIEAQKNDVLNNPNSSAVDKQLAQQKAVEETQKTTIAASKATTQAIVADFEKTMAANKEMNDTKSQNDEEYYSKLLQNNNLSLQQQLSANEKIIAIKKDQLGSDYDNEEETAILHGANQDQLKALEVKYQSDLAKIDEMGNEQRLSIIKTYNQKAQADTIAAQNALKTSIASTYQRDVDNSTDYSAGLNQLNTALAKREITVEEYDAKLKALQTDFNLQQSLSQIGHDNDELLRQKAAGENTLAQQEKINNDLHKLNDEANKNLLDARKSLADSEKQLAQDVLDFVQTVGDSSYQKKINSYDKLKIASDNYYNNEITNIQKAASIGALTTQQATERTLLAQAEQQSADEQYTRKENDIKQKQARFDKAAQVAQVIGQGIQTQAALAAQAAEAGALAAKYTAEAIGNPLLAPAAAALTASVGVIEGERIAAGITSALLAGKILATPIPTYAQGLTGNKGAHIGIYGEDGPELIQKPGIAPYVATSATVDYLPANTKITPIKYDELNQSMNNAMAKQTAYLLNVRSYNEMMAAKQQESQHKLIEWQTKQLIKAFGKTKAPVINNQIGKDLEFLLWKNKQINW